MYDIRSNSSRHGYSSLPPHHCPPPQPPPFGPAPTCARLSQLLVKELAALTAKENRIKVRPVRIRARACACVRVRVCGLEAWTEGGAGIQAKQAGQDVMSDDEALPEDAAALQALLDVAITTAPTTTTHSLPPPSPPPSPPPPPARTRAERSWRAR